MKNALLKFAGLFVERIPAEDLSSTSLPPAPTSHQHASAHAYPGTSPMHPDNALGGTNPHSSGSHPSQPLQIHGPPPLGPQAARARAIDAGHGGPNQPVAVALRAWVPESYAAILAAHGLHVVAAGGDLTSDQARTWGAQILLVSMECLGSDTRLVTNPALATVLITNQPMVVADAPGLMQVTEPVRASELAAAARSALADWVRMHG